MRRLAIVIALFALAGTTTTNILLARIDDARAATTYEHANVVALRLELVQLERQVQILAERPPVVVDEVARRRTEALRGAIASLLRLGKATLVTDPGMEWHEWSADR